MEYTEGWKNQAQGTSCTTIFPSYTLYTKVWASLLLATLVPRYVTQGFPSHSLFHSTSLSHATTIWGMYLGYTIPSKGRNHLIRYLANPLWSLETLIHAKDLYGKAWHYEVHTLLSMVCNLFYTITPMTCCTGRLADALDRIQDNADGVHLGSVFLYGVPSSQREKLAHIGCV